jgi:flagellar P-ring protein precursor FlgI
MVVLNRGTTVSEVARALNLLGASPRDIISIFQALKEAGALHADLRVM